MNKFLVTIEKDIASVMRLYEVNTVDDLISRYNKDIEYRIQHWPETVCELLQMVIAYRQYNILMKHCL